MKEDADIRLSRRRFLGLMGASAAFAAGCSRPDRGAIVPYNKRPEGVTPGLADFYASTFQEGLTAYGVLIRIREGRPLHLQGNDEHPGFRGKTSPRAIADILRLYDPDRLRRPIVDGRPADWARAEARILPALKAARKPVLLLSGALLSPTRRALVDDLRKALPGGLVHAAWEPACGESEAQASRACFGDERRSRLRLDRAEVVVSFEADLLAGERTEEIAGFASRRAPAGPEGPMNRLYAFEGAMSLTGANSDHRTPWKPSRAAALAFALARALHRKGVPLPPGVDAAALAPFDLDALAREQGAEAALLHGLVDDLKRAGRAALAAAGPALSAQAHAACHLLNVMLGAEGRTVDAAFAPPGEALAGLQDLRGLLRSAAAGKFAAAVFWQANFGYASPDPELWKSAAAAIPLKVRIGLHEDETALACEAVLPEHHWLEAWGDFEPASDLLSLQQPAVGPLYDTRQGEDILLGFARALAKDASALPSDYREYLLRRWRREVYPTGSLVPFERFWQASLHDGVLRRRAAPRPPRRLDGRAVNEAALGTAAAALPAPGFEFLLSPGAGVYDGRYANNGWLQELPDPITKLTWGNAAALSPQDAERLRLKDGDIVRLEAGSRSAEIPVVVQPGQAPGVLSAALGFGRRTGSVASRVGVDLYPLLGAASVSLTPTGAQEALPFAQRHHSLEGRDAARSLSLSEYGESLRKGRPERPLARLYPPQRFPARKWAMAVDLSACVGCGACLVACQSENNVPVVGPERVLKGREMHWMRIDRYYAGPPERPRVLLQPMLCQHCDDAPCESVCPVNATNHDSEGLNQMAYNRCVGTRYCSNNCPYKVRRFNFFEYAAQTREPASLAFNPEVTVRPRGVMEKCTFCVQRIQEAKSEARAAGRPLREGDVEPACAAACPAGAIVFGDLRDPSSRVSKLALSDRGYRVLEELGIRPSVTYLADLTNPAGPEERRGA
jgi:molybdopterin-containing oxidoreductase family iron-sulfur binding subunit